MCKDGKCGGKCAPAMIGKILLIIGGINWLFVGIGMLVNGGDGSSLNLVHMVFATVPPVEAIIYILVGIAGVMKIFGCKCKKCTAGCESSDKMAGGGMQ